MELNDKLTTFRPAKPQLTQTKTPSSKGLRIAFLSQREMLRKAVEESSVSNSCTFVGFSTLSLIEESIEGELCDVAIIDIHRDDAWPGSIFSRFDDKASVFPIIILCRNRREVSTYFRKAEYIADIFPYDAICDPRFFSVIEAAKFRWEFADNDRQAEGRKDNCLYLDRSNSPF